MPITMQAEHESTSQEWMRIFQVIPVAVAIAHIPGNELLWVSPAMERLLGISGASLVGTRIDDLQVWVDFPAKFPNDGSEELVCPVSFRQVQSGDTHDAVLNASESSLAGSPVRVITLTDVTQRRETERALIWQHEQLRRQRFEANAILDAVDVAIALVSLDGRLVLANRMFLGLIAIPADDALGVSIAQLQTSLSSVFDNVDLAAMLAGSHGSERQEGLIAITPEPDERVFEIFSHDLVDRNDSDHGRMFVFRDVTRQRESDRLKDEFAANISHELRTPLTSIAGFADLLLEDESHLGTDVARRYLEVIQRNTAGLIEQVNQLLDFSRAKSGAIEVRLADIVVGQVVDRAVALLQPRADQKCIAIHRGVSPDLPSVKADGNRLYQILINLLSNAIMFTHSGGSIRISAERDRGMVAIHVADNGIGLGPKEQELIFSRFYRVQTDGARTTPGTGLGLPIARMLAEQMGGSIDVESQPGVGSVFTTRLPTGANG